MRKQQPHVIKYEFGRKVSSEKIKIKNLNLFKFTKAVKKSESNSYMIEQEIDHEKAILEKLEAQAVNTKYEAKIQYLEVEIDTLRSKIRKLLKVI
jgi:hypothetical protein